MGQSESIQQVLESKEFRAWVSEKPEYLFLKTGPSYFTGAIVAILVGSLTGLMTVRNFAFYLPVILGISAITFFIYWRIVGFGQSRILCVSDKGLNIRTESEELLDCTWDEVLEIRPNNLLGFEVVSEKGSACVWWPPNHADKDGYDSFYYCVFRAMSRGIARSDLRKFSVPIELESGKEYEYRLPRAKFARAYLVIISLIGLLALGSWATPPHKFPAGMLIQMVLWTFLGLIMMIGDPSHRFGKNGDRIRINGDRLEFQTRKGTKSVPFVKMNGELQPKIQTFAFQFIEAYGNENESIKVDRRFLVPVNLVDEPKIVTKEVSA